MVRIILVDDIRKQMKKDNALIQKVADGKAKMPKHRKVRYMTPELFAKLFSPKRLRLLTVIKENHLESISDLARKTNRRFEAVHRDCSFFAREGIISFKEHKRSKIPVMKDKLQVIIA